MRLDGAHREDELVGDLGVRQAAPRQLDELRLARGELERRAVEAVDERRLGPLPRDVQLARASRGAARRVLLAGLEEPCGRPCSRPRSAAPPPGTSARRRGSGRGIVGRTRRAMARASVVRPAKNRDSARRRSAIRRVRD